MSTELPKTYDPATIESSTYQMWLDEKCFHVGPNHPGEPYAIVIPPPNVTGALHLGHAINNTLQDILTRKARMEGKAALWMPGLDHAGIATQAVVEKTIKEKEGKDRYSLAETPEKSREELIRRIWEWKQQYGDRIISQLKRLGCSCDWDRTRFTLDEQCAKAVRETFFKLFKDGLVYRGKKLVNWDTHLQTSISNDEIYHEKIKTHLWHIRYEIVDDASRSTGDSPVSNGAVNQQIIAHKTEEQSDSFLETIPSDPDSEINLPNDNQPDDVRQTHVTIATTRPETLLGDTAVAVNSQDPRWNWAIGKQVRLPLLGRLIPIIADDILVDPKFGSGVVKVTPAHDPNDYAVWERHRSQADAIDIINILNPDGTLNDAAGPYKGLTVNKARHAVVNDLTAQGLLVKEEPYETEIGHSDRSKTPIQPYLSDQWFVKMAPLAEPALQVVRDGTIQFFPERHAQQYLSWLGEKRDWPISRQLWWGHRIPVWTSPPDFEVSRLIQHDAFNNAEAARGMAWAVTDLLPSAKAVGDAVRNMESLPRNPDERVRICVAPGLRWIEEELEKLGFTQDPDVLDTWFSSALWPFSTLGWPEKTDALAKWYPTSVLLTGRDIITLWVARMVMMGMYNMGTIKPGNGEGLADAINFGPEQFHDLANSPRRVESPGHDPNLQEPESPQHEKELRYPPAPSPGNPGEGSGAAAGEGQRAKKPPAAGPHPNPPPEYRERGQDKALGIPFAHVAINPTILDGKGERMSKSKGNGVDPVDVIDTHGADALRFTLATMATETQDVRMPVKKDAQGRNTSDKFDLGRNFANKLWNAARFVLSTIESTTETRRHGGASGDPQSPSKLSQEDIRSTESRGATGAPPYLSASVVQSLPDRWILSRLNRTIDTANKAIAQYRFDLYAQACYQFFWDDFCAWYLEGTKVLLKNDATRASSLQTLVTVLDGSLRLMHPVIPFITETLWQKLNDVAPSRPLCGRIDKRLILSEWPKVGEFAESAEHIFPRIQEIVGTIRNLRNEHKVDVKKPVTVSIQPPGAQAVVVTDQNRELIESLATCRIKQIAEKIDPPAGSVRATVNANCELFVEDLADPAAEQQRSAKRIEELTKQIAAMKGRLANAGYIAKAPPKLVEETKQQLADAEAELAKLKS